MNRRTTAAAGLLVGLAVAVGAPATWYVTTASSAQGVGALPVGLSGTPVNASGATSTTTAGSAGAASTPLTAASIPIVTASIPPVPATLVPTHVLLPTAGIDASVDAVGVTPTGAVAIPHDAHRLGWYRYGPAPGDPQGSAVLVGHRDSRTQGAGALYDLGTVGVGDPIIVVRSDGTRLHYRIVERRLYLKKTLPFALLFARTGPPRLTILTCGGPYDRAHGGYQDNLVVTAIPA